MLLGLGYFSEATEMLLGLGSTMYISTEPSNIPRGTNIPGGRKRWCNNYVVRDDGKQMFMLSNSGPGEANAPPPVCPAAPDPKQLENTGINRADEPTASGAVFADVMMKL
jgi:hypothetical protein